MGGGVVSLEYVGEGNFVATRAARRRSFRVAFGCCCCCGGADAYKAGKLLLLLFQLLLLLLLGFLQPLIYRDLFGCRFYVAAAFAVVAATLQHF